MTDDEVLDAMEVAFREFKLVVEPGGAVALAAALTGKLPVKGRTVAVICSGGNVDHATFIRALQRHKPHEDVAPRSSGVEDLLLGEPRRRGRERMVRRTCRTSRRVVRCDPWYTASSRPSSSPRLS